MCCHYLPGCKLGFYGDNCSNECECEDSCTCDPVTGACNYTYTQEDYLQGKSILHSYKISNTCFNWLFCSNIKFHLILLGYMFKFV